MKVNRGDADLETLACRPAPVNSGGFHREVVLPYGCTVEHIRKAMTEFIDFLGFINQQLHVKSLSRLEAMLMPANFSSMVGEFMSASIPKYCRGLVKNRYHNGHPDLLPANRFPGDSLQHGCDGIEIKGSRYLRGWQGHNPEDCWLMVFAFDSNRPVDVTKGILPRPFRFLLVAGAQLMKTDWLFSGRSATSRRTITASVTRSGYQKMLANWIYKDSRLTGLGEER
jgi:hypothetical protein